MTIDAEKKRTFGQFYKGKKSKGSLFEVNNTVQVQYKNDWYIGTLVKSTGNAEWKINLLYMKKPTSITAKQHQIRRARGKSAQEKLGLISEEELQKLKNKNSNNNNNQKKLSLQVITVMRRQKIIPR
eukprot:UN02785